MFLSMRRPVRLLIVVVLMACSGPQNKINAANAAITAGAAVAAAAIVRAATDECWAYACPNGLVCDKDSGMCVEPPELAAGPTPETEDERKAAGCIQEDDGSWLCPDDPKTNAADAGAPTDAGAPRDGGSN
jgi:hypothetical protein